jgi:hypothetical protein
MEKVVSFVAVSLKDRLIFGPATSVAARLEGAVGGTATGTVTEAVFDQADSPIGLTAFTR